MFDGFNYFLFMIIKLDFSNFNNNNNSFNFGFKFINFFRRKHMFLSIRLTQIL